MIVVVVGEMVGVDGCAVIISDNYAKVSRGDDNGEAGDGGGGDQGGCDW